MWPPWEMRLESGMGTPVTALGSPPPLAQNGLALGLQSEEWSSTGKGRVRPPFCFSC